MPNPNSPRGKGGGGSKSTKRGKRQPVNANLADEPSNETNLEDYHFSEFFPHEELQTQRAAARRRSSGSLSASAAIVATAAAETGNLSNSSNMVLDPERHPTRCMGCKMVDHWEGPVELMHCWEEPGTPGGSMCRWEGSERSMNHLKRARGTNMNRWEGATRSMQSWKNRHSGHTQQDCYDHGLILAALLHVWRLVPHCRRRCT